MCPVEKPLKRLARAAIPNIMVLKLLKSLACSVYSQAVLGQTLSESISNVVFCKANARRNHIIPLVDLTTR